MIPLPGTAYRTRGAQILEQGSQKRPALHIVRHGRAQQAALLLAKEAGISAVAEHQPVLSISGIDGMGCAVHQIFDELQLGTQSHLGCPALAHLFVQREAP